MRVTKTRGGVNACDKTQVAAYGSQSRGSTEKHTNSAESIRVIEGVQGGEREGLARELVGGKAQGAQD